MIDGRIVDPGRLDRLDDVERSALLASAEHWRERSLGRLVTLLTDELLRRDPGDRQALGLRAGLAIAENQPDALEWVERARAAGSVLTQAERQRAVMLLVAHGRILQARIPAAAYQAAFPSDIGFAVSFVELMRAVLARRDPGEPSEDVAEGVRLVLATLIDQLPAAQGNHNPKEVDPQQDQLLVDLVQQLDDAASAGWLAAQWVDRHVLHLAAIGGPDTTVAFAFRLVDRDRNRTMQLLDALESAPGAQVSPPTRARIAYLRAYIAERRGHSLDAVVQMRQIADPPWPSELQQTVLADFEISAGLTSTAWNQLNQMQSTAQARGTAATPEHGAPPGEPTEPDDADPDAAAAPHPGEPDLPTRTHLRAVHWSLLPLTYDRGDFDRYWRLVANLAILPDDEARDPLARAKTAPARAALARDDELDVVERSLLDDIGSMVDWSTAIGAGLGAGLIVSLNTISARREGAPRHSSIVVPAERREATASEPNSRVREALASLSADTDLGQSWRPYLLLQIGDYHGAEAELRAKSGQADLETLEEDILLTRALLGSGASPEEALATATSIVRRSSDRFSSRLLLIESLVADQQLEDAYVQVDRICREAPRLVPARLWRAETAFLLSQAIEDESNSSQPNAKRESRRRPMVGSVQLLTRATHDYAKALELSARTRTWIESSRSEPDDAVLDLGSDVIPPAVAEHVARRGAHAAIRAEEALVAARLPRDRELNASGRYLVHALEHATTRSRAGEPSTERLTARGRPSDGLHAESIRLRKLRWKPRLRWWRRRAQKIAGPVVVGLAAAVVLFTPLGADVMTRLGEHGVWLFAAGAVIVAWPYVREFEVGGVGFSKDVLPDLDGASDRVLTAFLAGNPYGQAFGDLPFPRDSLGERSEGGSHPPDPGVHETRVQDASRGAGIRGRQRAGVSADAQEGAGDTTAIQIVTGDADPDPAGPPDGS